MILTMFDGAKHKSYPCCPAVLYQPLNWLMQLKFNWSSRGCRETHLVRIHKSELLQVVHMVNMFKSHLFRQWADLCWKGCSAAAVPPSSTERLIQPSRGEESHTLLAGPPAMSQSSFIVVWDHPQWEARWSCDPLSLEGSCLYIVGMEKWCIWCSEIPVKLRFKKPGE